MSAYFLLFTVPLLAIALGGAAQVWDEMFGSEASSPIEGMDRPTARVQFSLLQPDLAASLRGPLGLSAEVPIVRRPIPEDSKIAPVIVVGDFSVLGSLTGVAAATPGPLPIPALPIAQAHLVPAWLESGRHDSTGHA